MLEAKCIGGPLDKQWYASPNPHFFKIAQPPKISGPLDKDPEAAMKLNVVTYESRKIFKRSFWIFEGLEKKSDADIIIYMLLNGRRQEQTMMMIEQNYHHI